MVYDINLGFGIRYKSRFLVFDINLGFGIRNI
jgi:hypothetical protein